MVANMVSNKKSDRPNNMTFTYTREVGLHSALHVRIFFIFL